jgi:predicted DNA-binding antitoxin AbrB/MazE fold protein
MPTPVFLTRATIRRILSIPRVRQETVEVPKSTLESQLAEATYEGDVLRLDHPLSLKDQQRVRVIVIPVPAATLSTHEAHSPEDTLRLAAQVYEGLSPEDIDEIERIAFDRNHFFTATE